MHARNATQWVGVALFMVGLGLPTIPRAAGLAARPEPTPDRLRVWRAMLAGQLETTRDSNAANRLLRGQSVEGWALGTAGDCALALRQTTEGVRIASLFDLERSFELCAQEPVPLFSLVVRANGSIEEKMLEADRGWGESRVRRTTTGLEARWSRPADPAFAGLTVTATAAADSGRSAWRWQLRVDVPTTNGTVLRAVFPQVSMADLGPDGGVLFPRGPGEFQTNIWHRPFQYRGNYPGGWCSMQLLAAYRNDREPVGLYCAVHDPWGSTKDIGVQSDPERGTVTLRFEHPAPDMGRRGNGFRLTGEAVWQLLRGDWFEVATIYKDWARREARWWPRDRNGRRPATPQWFRGLNAWAQTGGGPGDCVSNVLAFQRYLDVPVGFHWYNWHQIPFDNDYPHYFPAREGFAAGVATLKQGAVFPMPYINGRLWDTHDRGATDLEFTREALESACKQADGLPFIESYGSQETNGQAVRLAVMCPSTPLWQRTVRQTVLRLFEECGTSAVYIDQVAAAAPALCQDTTHTHPLGGGHWWNEGYWQLLSDLRAAMPPETALTTECNGEPFIRWFDGYLTWHWQYDGQVPVFPAVYGGTIRMFGRAYRGGDSKDLALRMKAGQQLVFGEQLGWLDPALARETSGGSADFFRLLVQTRARLTGYFDAGEMARPPRLAEPIPEVRADWQWSGEWWVRTPALLTSAWIRPQESRLLWVFVNVGDHEIRTTVRFDPDTYGIWTRRLRIDAWQGQPGQERQPAIATFDRPATFAPRSVQTWEFSWR